MRRVKKTNASEEFSYMTYILYNPVHLHTEVENMFLLPWENRLCHSTRRVSGTNHKSALKSFLNQANEEPSELPDNTEELETVQSLC